MPETRAERRARWEAAKQQRLRRARVRRRVGGVLLVALGLLGVGLAIHEGWQGSWLTVVYKGLNVLFLLSLGVALIQVNLRPGAEVGLKGELLRTFREAQPPARGDAATGTEPGSKLRSSEPTAAIQDQN